VNLNNIEWDIIRYVRRDNVQAVKLSARARYIIATSIIMALTIASCVVLVLYWDYIQGLDRYGYVGAFALAFIAGSSLPLPVSYLILTFTLGGILNPIFVGLASGVGAGTGGTLIFLLGRSGRKLFPGLERFSIDEVASTHFAARFLRWAHKRGSIVVFVMSAMFNPIFAPMAITMGALRFRAAKFFLWCVVGNTVKSLIIAFAGYLGLGILKRLLG
jgi:membrane protein YqaA with SNARE-associated domain